MSPFSRGCSTFPKPSTVQNTFSRSCPFRRPIHLLRQSNFTSNCHRFVSGSQSNRYASIAQKVSTARHQKSKPIPANPSLQGHNPKSRTATPLSYQPQTSGTIYEGGTLQEKLLRRPTPTILYQGPSQGMFTAVCFTAGALCLTAGGYTFYEYFWLDPFEKSNGMNWVKAAEGVTIGFYAVIAAIVVTRPFRLVRSITAIPINGVASRQLAIDIESQSLIPFKNKGQVIRKPASELSLNKLLAPLSTSPSVLENGPLGQAAENTGSRRQIPERQRGNNFIRMFKKTGRLFGIIYLATSKMFSTNHIRYIRVPGKGNWKLDLSGAWTLDNGRAIDRLIKVSD